MGNNIKTGNKRPKTKDRMLASAQLPPLPKMYQMGIAKGIEQERERIIKLLEDNLAAAAPKPDIIAVIKGENK
jgi:hypothetical protein